MVTLNSAENVLKTVYLDVLSNQLNTGVNPFYAQIKQSSDDVFGKEVRMLAPYGVNGGISAGTEDGDLPRPNGNKYAQFTATLKNLYGQIEITDKAIRASESSSGAFVNLLNAEMEGLLTASKLNLGRMLFGNGSGKIAVTTSVVSDLDHIKLKNKAELRYFTVGQVIDCFKSATTYFTGARIQYIDYEGGYLYLDKNVTIANECDIYIQDSKDKEITGLGAIFDTAKPIYGLNRTQNTWLNPTAAALPAEANDITDAEIQKAVDVMEERCGSSPDMILCSAGVRRNYQQYQLSFKRNTDVMELAGGYKAISYNGIPIVYDRFCPSGTMYLLNSKDFVLSQLCDWRWLETENGKILRQSTGKAAYTATLVKYAELICRKPGGQSVITGIKDV
ncbi:MAG: phage major capsid protein [Clostridiales bacterium]|jgi:hypothetical protein|nr:phage major capsid protein [Clostridiales bacterium]